jgi:hypothetical protein
VQNLFGKKRSRGGRKAKPREVPSPMVALQEIQLEARHWLANHQVWFADKKAALRKLSKRNQTDELYEELSRAAVHGAVRNGYAVLGPKRLTQ